MSSKNGHKIRSRLYTTEELRDKVEEYFSKSVYMQSLDGQKEFTKPKTIEGLASHLGVVRETLFKWEKEDEEFAPIIKRAKERISEDMIIRALSGEFKEGFVKFLMTNNHDYKERQEVLSENVGEIKIKRETLTAREGE